MPKLKTHRGAAKRIKKTAGGYRVRRANRNHILSKKNSKRKRQLRSDRSRQLVRKCDVRAVEQMLHE